MSDLIRRQDAIDKAYRLDLSDTGNGETIYVVDVEEIKKLPSAGCRIETLPSAIDYLNNIGWLPEHDRILTESAKRKSAVIEQQEYIELWPCKCGCNRYEFWYSVDKEKPFSLVCQKCHAKVEGRTEKEVRLNWNRMVSEND